MDVPTTPEKPYWAQLGIDGVPFRHPDCEDIEGALDFLFSDLQEADLGSLPDVLVGLSLNELRQLAKDQALRLKPDQLRAMFEGKGLQEVLGMKDILTTPEVSTSASSELTVGGGVALTTKDEQTPKEGQADLLREALLRQQAMASLRRGSRVGVPLDGGKSVGKNSKEVEGMGKAETKMITVTKKDGEVVTVSMKVHIPQAALKRAKERQEAQQAKRPHHGEGGLIA